jgi:hypothetical protein
MVLFVLFNAKVDSTPAGRASPGLGQAHLVEERGHGRVGLGGGGLLALSPANDPVLDRLATPPSNLGQAIISWTWASWRS